MQAVNCNGAWLCLTLLQGVFLPALLTQLIPNTTAAHTIIFVYYYYVTINRYSLLLIVSLFYYSYTYLYIEYDTTQRCQVLGSFGFNYLFFHSSLFQVSIFISNYAYICTYLANVLKYCRTIMMLLTITIIIMDFKLYNPRVT